MAWDDVELKPLSVSFHYRRTDDEDEAVRLLAGVERRAHDEGLVPRWGRKVLELRPPLRADKGTAVRQLLRDRNLRRALYAGDDTTDLDAFAALDGLEVARPRRRRHARSAADTRRGRRPHGRQPRRAPGAPGAL